MDGSATHRPSEMFSNGSTVSFVQEDAAYFELFSGVFTSVFPMRPRRFPGKSIGTRRDENNEFNSARGEEIFEGEIGVLTG